MDDCSIVEQEDKMANTREIIMKLKEVREEKNLSFGDILEQMEQNGDYLSKSTLSRVFADGSEEQSFRYDETIRPIAKVLLDIETIEESDNTDVKTMKLLLQFKMQKIEELERQVEELKELIEQERKDHKLALDEQIISANEKMDVERAAWNRSIEFLKEQISYKDKRMDLLLDSVREKDDHFKEILDLIITCPSRKAAMHED